MRAPFLKIRNDYHVSSFEDGNCVVEGCSLHLELTAIGVEIAQRGFNSREKVVQSAYSFNNSFESHAMIRRKQTRVEDVDDE